MHRSSSIYKQKQSKTVLNKYVGDVRRQQGMDILLTGGSIIMDYEWYFGQKQQFKAKMP